MQYKLITTQQGLEGALAQLNKEVKAEPLVGIDTETYSTGLSTIYEFGDPYTNAVRLVQLKTRFGSAYIFDIKALKDVSLLVDFLNRSDIVWTGYNLKFEYKMLKHNLGVTLRNMWCSYIAVAMIGFATGMTIRKAIGMGLGVILKDYLNVEVDKSEQSSYWGGTLSKSQLTYAANDVEHLIPLMDCLAAAISNEYKCEEALQLEFDVLPVVGDMELTGIGFDLDMYRRVQECAKVALPSIIKELCDYFGVSMQRTYNPETRKFELQPATFNLNSRDDVLKAFSSRGIELPDLQAETLKNLADTYDTIKLYLDYKTISKQLTTDYEKYVHPLTKRIHSSFHQMGAATGRFSSSAINLQQIPKIDLRIPDHLVDAERDAQYFDKKRGGYFLNYRYCFTAEGEGFIASSDFGGQETSIMAVLSMDPKMIEILSRPEKACIDGKWVENPDADLHSQTAALAFGIDPKDARTKHPKWNGKTYRDGTKAVTFGCAYGQSEQALGPQLGITVEEAKEIINRFFKPLAGLKRWLDNASKKANETRLSRFALGRIRFLNDSRHSDKGAVGRAGRNVPIQGMGALMMKKALIYLGAKLEGLAALGIHARIVGTVHDEVLVEFLTPPEEYWDHTEYSGDHKLEPYAPEHRFIVKSILDSMDSGSHFFLQGIVPDRASCGVGRTWVK
jgi:DNA polymerase I-like protein with 3'-5' exonuclease and polymerase domains